MNAKVQKLLDIGQSVCRTCELQPVCRLAGAFLRARQVRTAGDPHGRLPHPRAAKLRRVVDKLQQISREPEADLLRAMAADDPEALLAGCLLAERWWKSPEKLKPFLKRIRKESSEPRRLSELEDQLLRVASLLQTEEVDEGTLGPYLLGPELSEEADEWGAGRILSLILSPRPVEEALQRLKKIDPLRLKTSLLPRLSDEEGGRFDLFLTTVVGKKRALLYLRRDGEGRTTLAPVDAIRVDSLIRRLFKVFHTDRLKTHRLFALVARWLNDRLPDLERSRIKAALKKLSTEDRWILCLYAPRLAKVVEGLGERYGGFQGFYRLIKFLHNQKGEYPIPEGTISRCHHKVFRRRKRFQRLYEEVGPSNFKAVCRAVLSVADTYREGPEWSSLVFRIGEVFYFLTALTGLNPKGLEASLKGKNPLAFIAYGMQPRAEDAARRYQRLNRLASRFELGSPEETAVNQGLYYLAKVHGQGSIDELHEAVTTAIVEGDDDSSLEE